MTASTANGGDRPDSATDGRQPPNVRVPLLRLRTVSPLDGDDRATIYPADAMDVERMETWLTVDASVVRDLSACR